MSNTQQYTDVPVDPSPPKQGGRVPRWVKWVVLGLIAADVLFFGAIFLYAKVINDSPDEFTAADLDAALSAEAGDDVATTVAVAEPTTPASVATGQPPVPTAAPATAPATTPASTPASTTATAATGTSQWVATDSSQVGYRVQEVLFGVDTTAVGRTNQVQGTLTVDGTQVTGVDFTVDVASIQSDESRRDSQFRGRVMSADQFPTATFVLTQPIELGVTPTDGAEVTTQATGDLTLRGVTNSVTFDVTAKQENGLIGVQGSIPVVFNDYGISNPSNGGIQTEDDGLVEFVLVFEPAA
ncbi:MAG TPA: YceI family protein [Ilumatobacteraceae bacterium]|nr:YceI family protein [Ilumatobacteraceae bacterium]